MSSLPLNISDGPTIPCVPAELLSRPVQGLNLVPGSLADQLSSERATLLLFLRHFGCIFCRETVGDVRRMVTDEPDFPPVLVFFMGDVAQGREFFATRWPDVRAIADESKQFYEGMGLTRGTTWQMFGPRAWACGLRALGKGHGVGTKVIGDPWLMPGAFLVDHVGQIRWRHAFAHAGDRPDWKSLSRFR